MYPAPWSTGKQLVESKRCISVFDIQKQSILDKEPLETRGFWSGGFRLEWRRDRGSCDTYVELLSRGPKNRMSAFTLVSTQCHYGGTRHWFLCPRCDARVAKLYEHEDNFSCRKCLDLEYASHLTNYHSIRPFIKRVLKYEKMKPRVEYSFYKGKLTKRAAREEKLRMQVERAAPFAMMELDRMARDTNGTKLQGPSF